MIRNIQPLCLNQRYWTVNHAVVYIANCLVWLARMDIMYKYTIKVSRLQYMTELTILY